VLITRNTRFLCKPFPHISESLPLPRLCLSVMSLINTTRNPFGTVSPFSFQSGTLSLQHGPARVLQSGPAPQRTFPSTQSRTLSLWHSRACVPFNAVERMSPSTRLSTCPLQHGRARVPSMHWQSGARLLLRVIQRAFLELNIRDYLHHQQMLFILVFGTLTVHCVCNSNSKNTKRS
jgi:hypothetical protein